MPKRAPTPEQRIYRAADAKRNAEQAFLTAILDAVVNDGMSYAAIAEHAGVSKSRIAQIVRTAGERS